MHCILRTVGRLTEQRGFRVVDNLNAYLTVGLYRPREFALCARAAHNCCDNRALRQQFANQTLANIPIGSGNEPALWQLLLLFCGLILGPRFWHTAGVFDDFLGGIFG